MTYFANFVAALEKQQGLNVNQLIAITNHALLPAHRELWRLCKRGNLFKLSAKPSTRYFTTAAIRDAMAEQMKAETAAHVQMRKEATATRSREWHRAKAAVAALLPKPPKPPKVAKVKPVKVKAIKLAPKKTAFNPERQTKKIDTRPIDDSKAIRTVWPTPPGRYEVSKDFRGTFSLVGVGRDATTGQAWRD